MLDETPDSRAPVDPRDRSRDRFGSRFVASVTTAVLISTSRTRNDDY